MFGLATKQFQTDTLASWVSSITGCHGTELCKSWGITPAPALGGTSCREGSWGVWLLPCIHKEMGRFLLCDQHHGGIHWQQRCISKAIQWALLIRGGEISASQGDKPVVKDAIFSFLERCYWQKESTDIKMHLTESFRDKIKVKVFF